MADTTIKVIKPGETYIDLNGIAMHNGIQYDAALTRNDKGQGQYCKIRLNSNLVDQLMGLAEDGHLRLDFIGWAKFVPAHWALKTSCAKPEPRLLRLYRCRIDRKSLSAKYVAAYWKIYGHETIV